MILWLMDKSVLEWHTKKPIKFFFHSGKTLIIKPIFHIEFAGYQPATFHCVGFFDRICFEVVLLPLQPTAKERRTQCCLLTLVSRPAIRYIAVMSIECVRKFNKTQSFGSKCECICHGRPNTDYCGYCSGSHTRFQRT